MVKGNVIIGNSGGEYGVRGYVSAYDAETGELVWPPKELGKCGRYRLCSSSIIRCQGGPREKQLLWYGGFVRDEKGELCDE